MGVERAPVEASKLGVEIQGPPWRGLARRLRRGLQGDGGVWRAAKMAGLAMARRSSCCMHPNRRAIFNCQCCCDCHCCYCCGEGEDVVTKPPTNACLGKGRRGRNNPALHTVASCLLVLGSRSCGRSCAALTVLAHRLSPRKHNRPGAGNNLGAASHSTRPKLPFRRLKRAGSLLRARTGTDPTPAPARPRRQPNPPWPAYHPA